MYMLRFACMRGTHILHTDMCMCSHDLKDQKLYTNKKQMQNFNVVSRPKFSIFFNVAIIFCCKLNIMYRKMDTVTIH